MAADDSKPATKGDVHHAFDALDRKIDRVAVELVRTQSRLLAVEQNMATKDDIRKVLSAVHDFAARSESFERTKVIHGQALTEVQVTLKDHERHLRRLES